MHTIYSRIQGEVVVYTPPISLCNITLDTNDISLTGFGQNNYMSRTNLVKSTSHDKAETGIIHMYYDLLSLVDSTIIMV